jgi:hypothetical protein
MDYVVNMTLLMLVGHELISLHINSKLQWTKISIIQIITWIRDAVWLHEKIYAFGLKNNNGIFLELTIFSWFEN